MAADLSIVLDHLRVLIDAGTLPSLPPLTMFAGPSSKGRICSACDVKFEDGEIEFEVSAQSSASVSLFFHRDCVEAWRHGFNGQEV
jgi:hypothetical protein